MNFLGIPVGCNQRTQAVWKSVINKLKSRLSVWSGRYLSMGARVTLINVVLNSIPIYLLSFYKVPEVVLKVLVRIQQELFWNGGMEKRSISWTKWQDVCRRKEEGELGIRCVKSINEAMLGKWRWRFMEDREALWRPLLEFRYGPLEKCVLTSTLPRMAGWSSLWWRDVIPQIANNFKSDWFLKGLVARLGDGNRIYFWKTKWLGWVSFADAFTDLFNMAADQNAMKWDFIETLRGVGI
ncbi:uncharacterized mitochondrial protein AtMg00310-like [Vicia villosa]|uniref:uncharacterized mitochondrial protein AtMg00310-like n=1 Tax=Vicia villosa TaxID=3911 RepID=UPI00273C8905|nr:uncharacterized mitochondrial protein AtMg00310-like [Vicia villosa]